MRSNVRQSTWLISESQPFSQSNLWELQQSYYVQQGIDAWRLGHVPHYVSSNPRMANSYAEIVVAFWRDQQQLGVKADTPFYLCELGAGAGRFAFHFLQRLAALCQQADIPLTDFCYIMTDISQQNLDYLNQHPQFQPYFASGLLDLAFFDINYSNDLTLQHRQFSITPGTLAQPFVVIANYLFDSIPQELFYIENGQIAQCLVSLHTDRNPDELDSTEILGHAHCTYDYHLLTETPYADEPYLAQLITEYQQTLSDTHLLFPAAGLNCLHRLQSLSQSGYLLLSADKGNHRLGGLQNQPPPQLVAHTGCVSLSVNYHALKRFCIQQNGIALFSSQQHNHVNVGCLLFLDNATMYKQTQGAYTRHVVEFGPDAFYSVIKHARQEINTMGVRDILAYVRLSLDDAHIFACYLARLIELAPEFEPYEWETVRTITERVWQNYYPIGEKGNLADGIANLLFAMGDYEGALTYLAYSVERYGKKVDSLINMALCQQNLGNIQQAAALLREAQAYDPGLLIIQELLESLYSDFPTESSTPSFPESAELKEMIKIESPNLVFRSGTY